MSSHRDYATERDWEWLRNDSAYSDALVFEPVNTDKDGATSAEKYEMIVTDKWTSKVCPAGLYHLNRGLTSLRPRRTETTGAMLLAIFISLTRKRPMCGGMSVEGTTS
jgi:hypothetical protein